MHSGPTEFGALLRRLRLAAGLSQEALAERARISTKAVGSLELGTRRAPYRETVELLLDALNATGEERSQLTAIAEKARPRGPRTDGQTPTPVALSNVLLPATRLIGRAQDLTKIESMLAEGRLVTLTGPGGVGKTRVALSVANQSVANYRHGSWLVDLSPLPRSASIAQTVATALRVPEARGVSLLETVTEFLREREILIVLDNCEHVLAGVAEFAQAALHRTEQLRILATSREMLRIRGESICLIRPLESPPASERLTVESILQYAAVELFCDRAKSYDAEFTIQESEIPAVVRIVRRLDGLPLAIELAAARVRGLGLKTIEERLDRRFVLLSGGDRAAPSRQQTLSATIQWSYDGLSPAEQILFRRLGVFVGSWSLEAAEQVCSDDSCDGVLDGLASLVDKSLVSPYQDGETRRYRFLESNRAFSLDAATASERSEAALRHARWVAGILKAAEDRIAVETVETRSAALVPELDNIRAALVWCDESDLELGAEIASLIPDFAHWHGLAEEGCSWVIRFLARLDEERNPAVRVRLLCGLARLTRDAPTRLDASNRAVLLAQKYDLRQLLAVAYMRFAVALYLLGRTDEALAANGRALEEFRRDPLQPNQRVAWTLQHRSWMLVDLGRLEAARDCIQEAIGVFRRLKARREGWQLCGDLAELEFAAGETERALQIIDEVPPENAVDPEFESVRTCNRAGYLLSLGDFTEAEATAREAVALAVNVQASDRVLHALEHLAAALVTRNEIQTAAQLAGFVEAAYVRTGFVRQATERSSHDVLIAALHRALSEAELSDLMSRGTLMTSAEAVALISE